jgi:hypothetical protein
MLGTVPRSVQQAHEEPGRYDQGLDFEIGMDKKSACPAARRPCNRRDSELERDRVLDLVRAAPI